MDLSINIEEMVKREIEEMDIPSIVKSIVNKLISDDVRKEINKIVQESCKRMVNAEIMKQLDGEVETDNGWGDRKKFNSFEDMFRAEFKKRLDGQYEIKRVIESAVKEKVSDLFKEKQKEAIDKVVKELTNSL
jgi:hypothetical protein